MRIREIRVNLATGWWQRCAWLPVHVSCLSEIRTCTIHIWLLSEWASLVVCVQQRDCDFIRGLPRLNGCAKSNLISSATTGRLQRTEDVIRTYAGDKLRAEAFSLKDVSLLRSTLLPVTFRHLHCSKRAGYHLCLGVTSTGNLSETGTMSEENVEKCMFYPCLIWSGS